MRKIVVPFVCLLFLLMLTFNYVVDAIDFEIDKETISLIGYGNATELYKQVVITDLEEDGREEIIIYVYHFAPTEGSLLIYDRNQNLLTYKKDITGASNNFKFMDLTGDGIKEIILETGGSAGSGLYHESLFVYNYNKKSIAEVFWGTLFAQDYHWQLDNEFKPKEYYYEINFEDLNADGVYEILQRCYIVNIIPDDDKYRKGKVVVEPEEIYFWDGEKYISN